MKYTDPDGEWVITALWMVANAYFGGVAANNYQFNPSKWDWSSSATWGGIILNSVHGYFSGVKIENSIKSVLAKKALTNSINNFSDIIYLTNEEATDNLYLIRGNNVDYADLWHEFRTGTGPESSLFLEDHPMTIDLKDAWIVEKARNRYYKYNLNRMIRYDSKFGAPGAFFSESMTEQFIGGARVSIIRDVDNPNIVRFIVDDTKDRNSLLFHFASRNPIRIPGKIIPFSTTYQRYVWNEPYLRDFFRRLYIPKISDIGYPIL